MFTVLLISKNQREGQILSLALQQQGAKVIPGEASYAWYLKLSQFSPDLLIIEMPIPCIDEIRFVELVRKHRKGERIVILGIGDNIDVALKKGLIKRGLTQYLERPLKFSAIMSIAAGIAKSAGKIIGAPTRESDVNKDVQAILSSETLPMAKIEIMSRHVSNMLAFPFTVAKALKVAESERSGATDLARVIEADPVIAANLLKVANTVFFAGSNRRIAAISDAIVRIGFRETKRIVMSMSVMNLFSKDNRSVGFDRVEFWYHSLAAAIIAEYAAKSMGGCSMEEAFLGGLLHDFGTIILDEFFPEVFFPLLDRTAESAKRFEAVMTDELGIGSIDVVCELFVKWKLPEPLIEAVRFYLRANEAAKDTTTSGKKLALCVALGDAVAKALGIGRECDQVSLPLNNDVFKAVHLENGLHPGFIERIYSRVGEFAKFLNMEAREWGPSQSEFSGAEDKKIGCINLTESLFVPPFVRMQNNGFSVEQIPVSLPRTEIDSRFDMLVLWCDEDTSPDSSATYTGVVRKNGHRHSPHDGADLFSPVLALCPKGEKETPDSPLLMRLPHEIDLRIVEKRIVESLLAPDRPAFPAAAPA